MVNEELEAFLASVMAFYELRRLQAIEAAWIIAEAERIAKESFKAGVMPDLFNLKK